MIEARRLVPINALAPGVQAIRPELDAAIARVLDSGYFLLGPETAAFERSFADYHGGQAQAVGVGTGTDALWIALKSVGVAAGDEVLTVANAGVPPVAAVVAAGARPIFCDVDPARHTLDPEELDRRVTPRTTAVLVVHLYGRTADMAAIGNWTRERGVRLVEDCAQAHGARAGEALAGTLGDAAAFSFFPTKNLGALGDGGAVLASDPAVVDRARLLRMYGWRTKYLSETHSTVTRLDELQAAVLGVKLPHLNEWNARRRHLAALYDERLAGVPGIQIPAVGSQPGEHVYHLYVIRTTASRRDSLRAYLAERGVGTDVHYPLPAHLQTPYAQFGAGPGSLPHTEAIAREVASLPMYPELPPADAEYVADAVKAWARADAA